MSKPLDTQSKFMGVFKVADIYILFGLLAFFLLTFQIWAKLIGFIPTLVIIGSVMTLSTTFVAISNSYPSGFFIYWFTYKTTPQIYIPGFEPIPEIKEKVN